MWERTVVPERRDDYLMSRLHGSPPPLWLLCFGFVLCGMVTVLPGPLLPVMAARWGLHDLQSGGFFAAEFLASTVGSIFSPWRLRRHLPAGYALMILGLLLLVAGPTATQPAIGHAIGLAAFALIGLGIGLSVTATNLTVARMGAAEKGRARRLSVVNLFWGAGSVACPWLIAAAERVGMLESLLAGMALLAAAIFLALAPLLRGGEAASVSWTRSSWRAQAGILGFFALLLFLYVGVETVVGGWVTTYAHRFSGMTLEQASLMVSLYWLALLAGRGLGSMTLRSVPERMVLVPSLCLALAAVTLLLAPHGTPVVLGAVAAAGFGFGPVFPIAVSRMLGRVRDFRNTGWVFALCASGGAVLPWLTGLISTESGSLRVGFAVPVAALAAILALAVAENAMLTGQIPALRAQNSGKT